jgi:glycosyltransferase involved in cell wall biosynthesis
MPGGSHDDASRRPRRFVHLTAGNMFGGIETLLVTLACTRALAAPAETTFAVCFDGRLAETLRATGAEVVILGAVRARAPWTVLSARRRLRDYLRGGETLVCHGTWSQGLFGDVGRDAGANVFYMHGPVAGSRWTERLARVNRPHGVVANSRYTLSSLPLLYAGVTAEVCYCPVLLPTAEGCRAAVRAELGVADSHAVIVVASRLEPWKGHRSLIAALERLRSRSGWEAWVIGGPQNDGESRYLAELVESVRAAGLAGRVRFLGQRTDVPRLLRGADIHCQPNLDPEPFGIAFVEALAAGLPVVSHDFGGAAEIVTAECGTLVAPGDTGALAAALEHLILDASARRRLGDAGPARAALLTAPETQVPALVDAFERVAAISTCPPGSRGGTTSQPSWNR